MEGGRCHCIASNSFHMFRKELNCVLISFNKLQNDEKGMEMSGMLGTDTKYRNG